MKKNKIEKKTDKNEIKSKKNRKMSSPRSPRSLGARADSVRMGEMEQDSIIPNKKTDDVAKIAFFIDNVTKSIINNKYMDFPPRFMTPKMKYFCQRDDSLLTKTIHMKAEYTYNNWKNIIDGLDQNLKDSFVNYVQMKEMNLLPKEYYHEFGYQLIKYIPHYEGEMYTNENAEIITRSLILMTQIFLM